MLEDQGSSTPIYRQIYDEFRGRMLAGRLAPGERVRSSRAMAEELGVSRTTVLSAYNQLIAEGYLETRQRGGTYVSAVIPDHALRPPPSDRPRDDQPSVTSRPSARARELMRLPFPPPTAAQCRAAIDFRHGEPRPEDVPFRLWTRFHAAAQREADHHRAPPEGVSLLRVALAAYLDRARGVHCEPDQILITAGFQHGLYAIARAVADEGDDFCLEEPHYQGVLQALVAASVRPVPVPVDRQGLRTDRLPDRGRPRGVVLSPAHQFPVGGVLPLDRRFELLAWAAERRSVIVEDDYDSEYRYEGRPVATLMSLDDRGIVQHIGTFSKTLTPWLRVGFIVAPAHWVEPLRRTVWATHRFVDPGTQLALARLISEGHFERHIRRVRRRNRTRRDRLISACERWLGESLELWGGDTGGHMLGWLPDLDDPGMDRLLSAAEAAGVGLSPLRDYYIDPPRRQGLVIKYANLTEEEIEAGIERLSKLLC